MYSSASEHPNDPNTALTDLSELLSDGGEPIVLRLDVGQDVTRLSQLGLQLLHVLFIIRLLTCRLLDERLLAALAVSRHLLVVGVGLSKRLRNTRRTQRLEKTSGTARVAKGWNIYGKFPETFQNSR